MVQSNGSCMALSQRKTPIAKLRGILGPIHGQEQRFARLTGKSTSWVKKVSAGLIPLSEDTARTLQLETGISLAWLLGGIPGQPVDQFGKPYDFKRFQSYRTRPNQTAAYPLLFAPNIAAIGSAAGERGKSAIFVWRLKTYLDQCRSEFGFDQRAFDELNGLLEKRRLSKAAPFKDKGMDLSLLDDPEVAKAIAAARKAKKPGDKSNVHVVLRVKDTGAGTKPHVSVLAKRR